MTLETLPHHQFESRRKPVEADALTNAFLLDIADTLAAMEQQFDVAPPDERKELEAQKRHLIEELTAERPGEILLSEVLLLASVYDRRATETVLSEDGSKVRAFGTRERHGSYLEEIYILHEKPDGGFHYIVKRHADRVNLVYEIDDQAGLRVTRQQNEFIPAFHQPVQFKEGGEPYQAAVKDLLQASLTATGVLRARNEHQKAAADLSALSMIETSPFAAQFLEAHSSQEVEVRAAALMDVSPMVLSQDALRLIVTSRH